MWDFQNDTELRDAINSRDLLHLRSALNGVLMNDPTDSEGLAVKLLDYIQRSVPDIMETHDEEWADIVSDKSKWNMEYRNLMAGALAKNFSQTRFRHVVEVGKHVFPRKQAAVHRAPEASTGKGKKEGLALCAGVGFVAGLILLKKLPPLGAIMMIASIACGAYALLKETRTR